MEPNDNASVRCFTKSEEEVTRINDAYYLAFPGVKHYHDYCYARAQAYAYTENLFGIKYYGVSGHKLINLLIQGSAAYYLKWKIRELWEYTKANGIKSRFQMNIHDELSWERHKTETEVFFEFQRIMQDWPDTQVPIVAEMDVTTTTWADKKGCITLKNYDFVLAIDPSGSFHEGKGTTGWCIFNCLDNVVSISDYICAKTFGTMEQYWDAQIQLIARMHAKYKDKLIVVIEDYILYAHKAKARSTHILRHPS